MRTDAAYHQLIADLGATFRPQRTWVEGRGLLLIVGHFLSGVAAGGWLFSLWLDHRAGLVAALVAGALAGAAHLAFLGGAALYLLYPTGAPGRLLLLLSVAGAAIIIVYKGNVYAASKGVPFWNSPMMPILYATYAVRGGLALLLVLAPVTGPSAAPRGLGLIELWVAVSAGVMLVFYLGVMRRADVAARRSVAELTRGRIAGAFYLGTVGAGLLVPIALGLSGVAETESATVLALVGALSLGGDFFAKYTIAKAGIYVPVMPAGRT